MVKRVQFRFWLIAMASMGFCVVALIVVLNVINSVQTDRQTTRVLTEMIATVEALRSPQTEEDAVEWRVESYVETEPPAPTASPGEPSDVEEAQASAAEEDAGVTQQPAGKGGKWKGGRQPWWITMEDDWDDWDDWEDEQEEPEPSATPEPEETVINHYYYYYPEEDGEEDLRNSAMNQYAGRLCVVSLRGSEPAYAAMSDENALTEPEAIALAEEMQSLGKPSGTLDAYRYEIRTGEEGTRVYFLDCSTEYAARRSLLLISILVGLAGLLVTGVFVYWMSRRAIRPLRESMELQKRFITDAGHELKTPLAVIGTNMDILEMDIGKSEWVDGTKRQLSRLRKLVANLISLSRLEEMQEELKLTPFCVSETALECLDAFYGPAELTGKTLIPEITPELTIRGDVMTVGQLLTILCDNAVKYARGDIHVRLYPSGKRVLFETENEWDHGIPPEELDRLFDRFYRGDHSRTDSGGKSGYGLGLSIARAIAEKNKGFLTVEETSAGTLLFRASFRT